MSGFFSILRSAGIYLQISFTINKTFFKEVKYFYKFKIQRIHLVLSLRFKYIQEYFKLYKINISQLFPKHS